MKLIKNSVRILLACIIFLSSTSCKKEKKDDIGLVSLLALSAQSSGLATSPEATAANDNLATGIYKGVLTGSSGTVKINYNNSGTGAAPIFEYTYTPTGGTKISGSTTGQATVSNGIHTLTFSESIFTLTVVLSSQGSINSITLAINGTNVNVVIYKETSTSLVRQFEGTFTGKSASAIGGGTNSGVWNLTSNGETSIQASVKSLVLAGTTCTSNCDQKLPVINLDSSTKKFSGNSNTFTCVIGANCTCQTLASSSNGLTLTTNDISGSFTTTLASACVTGTGLGTLSAGYEVVTGTWTGTRTK